VRQRPEELDTDGNIFKEDMGCMIWRTAQVRTRRLAPRAFRYLPACSGTGELWCFWWHACTNMEEVHVP